MSIFNSVIQEHDKKKSEMDAHQAKQEAQKQAAKDEFVEKFTIETSDVVMPLFEEFVADAKNYGFPAKIEKIQPGVDRVYLSVTLIPEKGTEFGTNRSLQSVFSVIGHVLTQKVEYVSYYDQRPGKNGIERSSLGIASIKKDVIERELGKFLKMAMDARSKPERY